MTHILNIPVVPDNFTYLADKILNYTLLMVNDHPHRICEIEFYLNSPEHPDPYVHGHMDQTNKGTWYFHRFNNGTYKAATFKGLDIVLGYTNSIDVDPLRPNRVQGIYAAILIRSVIDINQRRFIEGPCNSVNHILSLSGVDSIIEFTGGSSLAFTQNFRNLILLEGVPELIEPLKFGPRIGLNKSGAGYDDYRYKYYRYAIGPVKKNKTQLQLVSNQ